jgi:hypothetical protein
MKLEAYFRLPNLRHYLIILTDTHTVIHHRREDDGSISTRIIRDGTLHLDPPGLTVAGLFPNA